MGIRKGITIVLASLLLYGCQSSFNPYEQQMLNFKKTLINAAHQNNKISENTQKKKKIPGFVADALIPHLGDQRRFSFSVANANPNHFFSILSEDTGINFIVSPLIKSKLSLSLSNVTVNQIISVLKNVYNLGFKRTIAGYFVTPRKRITRTFYISHLNIKRLVNSTPGSSSSRGSSSSEVTSASTNSKISTNYEFGGEDYWKNISNTIKAIIEQSTERSSSFDPTKLEQKQTLNNIGRSTQQQYSSFVHINDLTGLVTVHAFPDEITQVSQYIKKLQAVLGEQVLIEGKIIEISLNKKHANGIDWNTLFSQNVTSIDNNYPSGGKGFGDVVTLSPSISDNFSVVLKVLATQGKVTVLSSPAISTMNFQPAVIQVGSTEKFIGNISSTSTENLSTSSTSNDTNLESSFSGISLSVNPSISPDGTVMLHVEPKISKITNVSRKVPVGSDGKTVDIITPKTIIRSSDSIVTVQNNQMIVLGGLTEVDTLSQSSTIPGHGLFAKLAGSSSNTLTKRDLVILLKVIVLKPRSIANEVSMLSKRFS